MTPDQLKAWRAQAGLSQPGLAALLGVDPMTISRWERSQREIPPFLHLALEALRSRLQRRQKAKATVDGSVGNT